MALRIPLGVSDFRHLREEGLAYIDKSHLIREVLDKGAQSILLPRPRRFGKTLNLTMLRCFFEKRAENLWGLFADLSIARADEAYRAHFQKYPVVFISFKEVKGESWDASRQDIHAKISALFDEHRHLLDSDRVSELDRAGIRAILDGTADDVTYRFSLLLLTRCLAVHHDQKVVVLLDEYDTPIHTGWLRGYGREIITFFRIFLNAGLKDNPHLYKAVITGILRIAKESIFSDLNNLAVYTMLASSFSTCFGFTEPEVEALLAEAGLSAHMADVRAWYNGYVFGESVIYNPWSILGFVERGDGVGRPFWLTTSSNDLVRRMLERHSPALRGEIEALLEGGRIDKIVDEGAVLEDLDRSADALWSLLLLSGYLKAEPGPPDPREPPHYWLSIPNLEVRRIYISTFRDWLRAGLGGASIAVDRLTRALLDGDAEGVEETLQAFTQNLLSIHDAAWRPEPEQVYHAFVIGLLATLEPSL